MMNKISTENFIYLVFTSYLLLALFGWTLVTVPVTSSHQLIHGVMVAVADSSAPQSVKTHAMSDMPMSMPVHSTQTTDTDCPFMPGTQSVCIMNMFDHILAWKDSFTFVLIKSLLFVMLVLFVLYRLFLYKPNILVRIRKLQHRTASYQLPLFVLLFSSGILHPKAP